MTKRVNTTVIKPQLKIQFEQINFFKIDTKTLKKHRAHLEFIDSDQSYAIRQALKHLFEIDISSKRFLTFRGTDRQASKIHSTAVCAGG